MATGLLVCGFGQGTKLLTYLTGASKSYTATIRLGTGTLSDDADGVTTESDDLSDRIDLITGRLPAAVSALTGEIDQVPSSVSAIKVAGKRAYQRVRSGEDVTLAARRVCVTSFRFSEPEPVVTADGCTNLDVHVSVECSSGTYIRALARDLGRSLGTAGHLTALRRQRVGDFSVADAQPIVDTNGELTTISVAQACKSMFPNLVVSPDQAEALRMGQRISEADLEVPALVARQSIVAVYATDSSIVALAQLGAGALAPKTVFAQAS